ncbi:cell division protein FtsZ [Candidatus Dependentiae bacterium]|nr:cell division protein FtsZ [Candidatus Dependentiae bacterium]
MIEFDTELKKLDFSNVNIKIVGIGGAGGNTINSMIESGLSDVEFIVANSDLQAIRNSKAACKIQIGVKTTKGLGCGANPDLGRRATEEDLEKIMEHLESADIVFLVAGMGGGTGSGGAPVIAKALKERGILSIAVVTKPFAFEGKRRMLVAEHALEDLKKEIDTLIVVPNEKLLGLVDRSTSMVESFNMINELLIRSVKSISSIISKSGHINVDFADLCTIMKGMGLAMMGTGTASGENRAQEAARRAISSPLLENMDIKSARGVLLNISGGPDLTLHEISDAANVIYDLSDKNAHIILGTVIDQDLKNEVVVSVVATGFQPAVAVTPVTKAPYKQDASAVEIEKELILQPIYESKVPDMNQKNSKEVIQKNDIFDNNEFEVPAYLRKQLKSDVISGEK